MILCTIGRPDNRESNSRKRFPFGFADPMIDCPQSVPPISSGVRRRHSSAIRSRGRRLIREYFTAGWKYVTAARVVSTTGPPRAIFPKYSSRP